MSPDTRHTARTNLDRRLNKLRGLDALVRPPHGWIKAIREALGMSTRQLGARLTVSQARASKIEEAERSGAITLASLERAAQALDCRLVYALVPNQPLEGIVTDQATKIAQERLARTGHTMALEAQALEESDQQDMVKRLARDLAAANGTKLWDTP